MIGNGFALVVFMTRVIADCDEYLNDEEDFN